MSDETPAVIRAKLSSTGGWGWSGSSSEHVCYSQPVVPRSRTRCHCGCESRATHVGMANGVALTSGCEFYVRRWIKHCNA